MTLCTDHFCPNHNAYLVIEVLTPPETHRNLAASTACLMEHQLQVWWLGPSSPQTPGHFKVLNRVWLVLLW